MTAASRNWGLGAALAAAVAASANAFVVPTAATVAATTTPARSDFTGRVAIAGGRRLHLECRGSGNPTVILEAGLRVRSDYWSQTEAKPPQIAVLPAVARFTHVCAYDRPGTVIGYGPKDRSRSDPVPMPRSAMSAVDDVHALIRAAHLPLPVVLVGHSTGGLLSRLYAQRFPNDVSGLVLVDALPDGLRQHMTAAQYSTFIRLNTETPKELASYRAFETIPFDPAFSALRRLGVTNPLKPMPLVVISRGLPVKLPSNVPPRFSKALEAAWRTEQARLVQIEPGAEHIVATRSDHYIMFTQPDLIVRAIRDVVSAVRRGEPRLTDPG